MKLFTIGIIQALDTAELAADGPAADTNEVVQLFIGLAQALLHLGEPLPELVELRLDGTQQQIGRASCRERV